PYVKDSIKDAIVHKHSDSVNPANVGTKTAAHYPLTVQPRETIRIHLRLTHVDLATTGVRPFGKAFDIVFDARMRETNEFYATVIPAKLSNDTRAVMHQSLARMLWSKQYYHYEVKQ